MGSSRLRGGLVGLLTGALVVTGTGLLAPSQAYAATVDPSLEACPADQVPADAFEDVPRGTDAGRAADCLADLGIARGAGPQTFRPAGVVTRGQMVLFLSRVAFLGSPGPLNYSLDPAMFGDLDLDGLGEELVQAIEVLTLAGVVTGRADGSFGATDGVSRSQMALFLSRLHDTLGAAPLPVGTTTYDDLDGLSAEARDAISRITGAGIAEGVGPGRFDPSAGVSRQQMALFLTRLLQVEVAAGAVGSPYASQGSRLTVDSRFPQLRATARTPEDEEAGLDQAVYSVDGLAPEVSYTVALLPADQVRGTFRAAVFTDQDGDGLADPAPAGGPASVTVLEDTFDPETGEPVAPGDPGTPGGSTATFTADEFGFAVLVVRGTGTAGAVRPAVYPSDGGLQLSPDGTAAVPVGLGGPLTYSDREATDPPKVLSAVGVDDPSGDQLVVTLDKPVRAGGLYVLLRLPPNEDAEEDLEFYVLSESSGGTRFTFTVPIDLRAADQDSVLLEIFAADAEGNELAPIEVSPDLSNTG